MNIVGSLHHANRIARVTYQGRSSSSTSGTTVHHVTIGNIVDLFVTLVELGDLAREMTDAVADAAAVERAVRP